MLVIDSVAGIYSDWLSYRVWKMSRERSRTAGTLWEILRLSIIKKYRGEVMAKRDPKKTARNKKAKEITEELNEILEEVLEVTGYNDKLSLNAKIGGKHAEFYDVRHEVIDTSEQFVSLWLEGLMNYCNDLWDKELSANYELLKYMQKNKIVMSYVTKFLERTFAEI